MKILGIMLDNKILLMLQVLEEKCVLNLTTIGEFPLHFIPFDDDVLSLELDTAYKVSSICLFKLTTIFILIIQTVHHVPY